jgi:phosphatidylinositol glycan class Q protein
MGLMRVFWPSDAPLDSSPGVLVGFQNSESDLFVIGVLQEVEVRGQATGLRMNWC